MALLRFMSESPLAPRISQRYQRFVALGLTLVLHIAVIRVVAESLPVARLSDETRIMQVELPHPPAGDRQPDPAIILPTFTQPRAVGVTEPTIEIAQEPQAVSTLTALDLSQVLPPRPDAHHINLAPRLPQQFKNLGSSISAILRIFVETDDTVTAAEIVRSSGESVLDALAINYVKANWRFVPASAHGQPVADWTTVIVRFNGA